MTSMGFARDLRYGLRLLRKSPGFTLTAIVALAIGIGANVTIFGFVNAVLLRPIDAADPGRLVRGYPDEANPVATFSYDDYVEFRDRNQSLSSLAMFHWGGLHPVRVNDSLEMIHVMPVTGNYFSTLGVSAAMGRVIVPTDDDRSAPGVVFLSDDCWRAHFAARPDVIGQTIFINRLPFTIIGVTPPSFRGTIGVPIVPQFYVPWSGPLGRFDAGQLIGRLNPGVSVGAAQADLARIAAQLSRQRGHDIEIFLSAARSALPMMATTLGWFALLFMVIVGVVLLIACDNIALLLLARSAARRHEFAVRLAMGASRGNLVRQLLTECLVLSALGGIAAAECAYLTSRLLTQIYLPVPMPIALPFVFDLRVTLFTMGASLVTTLLFGLGPALQSMKTDVVTCLKSSGTTPDSSRSRAGLVVTQIAFSTALLVTAGTLVRSIAAPADAVRGFSTAHVLMGTVNLAGYTPAQGADFYARLQERLEAVPGVVSANITDLIPVSINRPDRPMDLRADNGRSTASSSFEHAFSNNVSPGHFRTLGIPLLQGRDFQRTDDHTAPPICIVNQSLARYFWPGESAVGHHMQLSGGAWMEVVGVVRDSKYLSLDEAPRLFFYRPLAQEYTSTGTILIKTSVDPQVLATQLRREVENLDPNLLAYNIQPFEDRIGLTLLPNRAAAVVAGVLGLVGLGLGLIGTYGIMSFIVQQRRREIGVRMALGAAPGNVISLIAGQGMKWAATGLAVGAFIAFLAASSLRRLLFGISRFDPIAFVGIGTLLAAVAFAACYFPARRASHIDPLAALRDE